MLAKLVCSVLALSLASSASAQTTVPKKPPVKKAPAPSKTAPKTPPPAPEPTPPPPPPPPPPSDVRIHTKLINGAQISENSTYFRGVRQRFEFPGITMINQCDLKRSVQLNAASKQFIVVSTDSPTPPPAATPAAVADTPDAATQAQLAAMSGRGGRGGPPKPKGGVIAETITVTDTGERKELFGREARHIKTVLARQPGPNACESKTTRVETDGWYVDLPDHDVCPSAAAPQPGAAPADGPCTDRVETRRMGDAKLGFAVATTTTTTIEDGKETESSSSTMEVTDMQVTSLDAELFDVPPGYSEVKTYQELLPALAKGGTLADALFGSIADGTSAVAPKKTGVVRIGVVDTVNKTDRNVPAPAMRIALVAALAKAPYEAVPLVGATPGELNRDAAAKACDFVVTSDLTELKSSRPGKVGGMLKKVSGDPGAQEEIHEARVDYKLYAIADQSKPRIAATAKASSGGGFGLSSALRVAAFAGSMYMGMTMGMMGGTPMMNMMGSYGSFGAGPGMGGGMSMVNPGMGAAVSMMSQASIHTPGMDDATKYKALETVEDALSKMGKQVGEELKKGKSSTGK
jgi:hypothetical protein